MTHEPWRTVGRRWLAFNLVGIGGIAVQLVVLAAALGCGAGYLPATAVAVETAVLHNFCWHERWTWADRRGAGRSGAWTRLSRFNLTTGTASIAGNLSLMPIFVEWLGLPVLPANVLSILILGILNFLVADRFVFRPVACCRGAWAPGRWHRRLTPR